MKYVLAVLTFLLVFFFAANVYGVLMRFSLRFRKCPGCEVPIGARAASEAWKSERERRAAKLAGMAIVRDGPPVTFYAVVCLNCHQTFYFDYMKGGWLRNSGGRALTPEDRGNPFSLL